MGSTLTHRNISQWPYNQNRSAQDSESTQCCLSQKARKSRARAGKRGKLTSIRYAESAHAHIPVRNALRGHATRSGVCTHQWDPWLSETDSALRATEDS